MNDIQFNSATVYSLENTLNNGKSEFSNLNSTVSSINISGVSSKIVGMFGEVKSSVSSICSKYDSIYNDVLKIKQKLLELFPEDALIFEYLNKDNSDELFDYLCEEVERICDVETLLKYFDSKKDEYVVDGLKYLPAGASVADYYNNMVLPDGTVVDGNTYANLLQVAILKKYSGREAATKSMLLPMALAADKGLKIPYIHRGTDLNENGEKIAAPIDVMLTGSDCNSLVSYGIRQGASVPFTWLAVDEFNDKNYNKYKISNGKDYSTAQIGDVLWNSRHVMMIIENNPETREMIVAESTGNGNMVTTWSYNEIYVGRYHGGFGAYDMSRFYE